jgi:hypothetical protein
MIETMPFLVNFFMNKFRKLGFIEYNAKLKINKSLSHLSGMSINGYMCPLC